MRYEYEFVFVKKSISISTTMPKKNEKLFRAIRTPFLPYFIRDPDFWQSGIIV